MLDIFFSILVPITLFIVYRVSKWFMGDQFFTYKKPSADQSENNIVAQSDIRKTESLAFSDNLKSKIKRTLYKASFVILPLAFLIWLVMAFELFDMAGRQSKVGPILISIVLILPLSVFTGACYLAIAFIVKLKHSFDKER